MVGIEILEAEKYLSLFNLHIVKDPTTKFCRHAQTIAGQREYSSIC